MCRSRTSRHPGFQTVHCDRHDLPGPLHIHPQAGHFRRRRQNAVAAAGDRLRGVCTAILFPITRGDEPQYSVLTLPELHCSPYHEFQFRGGIIHDPRRTNSVGGASP